MFGLEKKERKLFEFDLEKELKSNPLKAKELLKTTEARIQAVKTALRQGADSADFNKLSGLLTRIHTRNEAVVFLQIIRPLHRVHDDSGIEIREHDDQREINKIIPR